MSDVDIELTAYYGLYCPDCIRYKSKISDIAAELLTEIDNSDFEKYAAATGLASTNTIRKQRF